MTTTTTTRYAVVEYNTGSLWGIADAASPIEACRAAYRAAHGANADDRRYEDSNRSFHDHRFATDVHEAAYYVYEVPAEFDVGEDADEAEVARQLATFGREVAQILVTTDEAA